MKIALKPAPPIENPDQLVMAGNVQLGVVKPVVDSTNFKFHAVLNSKCTTTLYQGFGSTVDEALKDAITLSRARKLEELAELDHLENVIWGDHEINK